MKKSSASSSLSSSFDEEIESRRSKTVIDHHGQIGKRDIHDDIRIEEDLMMAQRVEKEIIYENVNANGVGDEENDEADRRREEVDKAVSFGRGNQDGLNNDQTIQLSIENLEEIRAKAASMSLPLLTALCSDQTLIRSLEKNRKNQASF